VDIDFTLPFTRCRYTVARRLRYSYSWLRLILVVVSTVATPGEWQCKIRTGGVRRLAVANGPNIFQMLLVFTQLTESRPWQGLPDKRTSASEDFLFRSTIALITKIGINTRCIDAGYCNVVCVSACVCALLTTVSPVKTSSHHVVSHGGNRSRPSKASASEK